jgi:hypothetical protein
VVDRAHPVSISSTLVARVFCLNVVSAAFI